MQAYRLRPYPSKSPSGPNRADRWIVLGLWLLAAMAGSMGKAAAQDLPPLLDIRNLDEHCPQEGTFLCLLAEEDFQLLDTGLRGERKAVVDALDGTLVAEDRANGVEVKFEPHEGDREARVRSWRFDFVAPENRDFVPGRYDNAVDGNVGTPQAEPLIHAVAWSTACRSSGHFDVIALGTDRRDVLRRLRIDFLLRCQRSDPAVMVGRVCIGCRGGVETPGWNGLVISHRAPPDPAMGERATLELEIVNRGDRGAPFLATAHRLHGVKPVEVKPSRGHCHSAGRPAHKLTPHRPRRNDSRPYRPRTPEGPDNYVNCYFGTLPAGETVTVELVVEVGQKGRMRQGRREWTRQVVIVDSADADLLPDHNRFVDDMDGGRSGGAGGPGSTP